MRSHAKASTAGSKRRIGKSKPALLLCVLVACVATLALVVGSASGATTRFLVEVFGSSAQPSFSADRGMAYDQGAGHLYVIDSTADTLQRFNANGTAADFGALGSNEIDGEGTGDETPLGHLAFESNRQREQVAIDESGEATDGNVYVTQAAKDVVDIFNGEGEYLGALSESTEGGAFGEPCGVTVDDEGTVYVGDRGDDRIHVFDPAAAVPVNGDSAATSYATVTDPCTIAAGDAATDGFLFVAASTGAQLRKVDATTGELKYEITTGASTVSVDPTTGHVFVARNTGTSSQVDEYDASGAAEATLVSSFKPGSTVEGIALNSTSEQVYVARSGTENVEVFGPAAVIPDVVTEAPSSNTGTRATLAGTVNPDGVELDECFFEWGQGSGSNPYTETAPCAESNATIGSGTSPVAVSADISGLKPQGTNYHYRLVAANPNGTVNGSNQNFITPNTVTAEAATGVAPTEATLNGTVNPDTATVSECVFEWGEEKGATDAFQAFPNSEPCVPAPGSSATPVAVSAVISGLHPGATYLYRLRVGYPTGQVVNPFASLSAQTSGPVIEGVWAEDVAYTEAILKTRINPKGSATTYRIEYGPTPAYGSETGEIGVGSDSSVHELGRYFNDLEPGSTLHFRVVATNGAAVNEGSDHTLTTYERPVRDTDCPNQEFRVGPAAKLPDCRGYEMVSPVDKGPGGQIFPIGNGIGQWYITDQAEPGGDKIAYGSTSAFGDALSNLVHQQYIATRSDEGWTTHGINPPHEANTEVFAEINRQPGRFSTFTEDLSVGFLYDNALPPLTEDALGDNYHNYYLWQSDDTFQALTTQRFAAGTNTLGGMGFQGYAGNADHVVFAAEVPLTPDAALSSSRQIYDYHDGELELVSLSPGGSPLGGGNLGFWASQTATTEEDHEAHNAISEDGSRIFWSQSTGGGDFVKIFARIDGETTIPISQTVAPSSDAFYWDASADGRYVVFSVRPSSSSNGSVYKFDVDTETPMLLAGETDAGHAVLGVSEDGSRVYLVSREALAPGAVPGQSNLYLDEEGAKTFIATLAKEDAQGTQTGGPTPYSVSSGGDVRSDYSKVTGDGRYLVFPSITNLTGYDTESANHPGEPSVQMYRYDAVTEDLACISCNPSGARPLTTNLYRPNDSVMFRQEGIGQNIEVAAWLPTARRGTYRPRVMTEDGARIFFNAIDALVPEDSNGVLDVYEWMAPGVEGCAEDDGCVNLISTGTSPKISHFVDASEDGRDVFFRTGSSIDPGDPTETYDIYDARVGGGFPHPVPPPECIGDACQSVPEPPSDPTPASAGFRGAGDPASNPNCGAQARQATRLSRRAKVLRRRAKRAAVPGRARVLRRRSGRFAKRAKSLSRRATRCRRAVRRAAR